MTRDPPHLYLNGQIVPEREARISPGDRGFLLGDGVFETLRACAGAPRALDRHLARLRRSATLTRIPYPSDVDFPAVIGALLDRNDLRVADAAIRITLTRGPGGRGTSPRGAGPPTLLVTATPVTIPDEVYHQGVTAVVSRTARVPSRVLDPRIKALGYLPYVLARAEAEAAGAYDAILPILGRDEVAEATSANVFALFDRDRLVTPPLDAGILDGITREDVIRLARAAGLRVEEAPLATSSLTRANEVFLTASVSEVVPVVRIGDTAVGQGTPGPWSLKLLEAYRREGRSLP